MRDHFVWALEISQHPQYTNRVDEGHIPFQRIDDFDWSIDRGRGFFTILARLGDVRQLGNFCIGRLPHSWNRLSNSRGRRKLAIGRHDLCRIRLVLAVVGSVSQDDLDRRPAALHLAGRASSAAWRPSPFAC